MKATHEHTDCIFKSNGVSHGYLTAQKRAAKYCGCYTALCVATGSPAQQQFSSAVKQHVILQAQATLHIEHLQVFSQKW